MIERDSGASASTTSGAFVSNGAKGMRNRSKLSVITEEVMMTKYRIKPVHPGVYLKELLSELKISQYRLAKELGVPAMRINLVVNCKRPVTADLALRLGRYFGQNPRYWMNLQSLYDMDVTEDALSEQVINEVRPLMKSGSDSHSYL